MMEPRFCPECGTATSGPNRFCKRCGTNLEAVGRVLLDTRDPGRKAEVERAAAKQVTRLKAQNGIAAGLVVLLVIGLTWWAPFDLFPNLSRMEATILCLPIFALLFYLINRNNRRGRALQEDPHKALGEPSLFEHASGAGELHEAPVPMGLTPEEVVAVSREGGDSPRLFCPRCKAEYRPGVAECTDCSVALVSISPASHATVRILETVASEPPDVAPPSVTEHTTFPLDPTGVGQPASVSEATTLRLEGADPEPEG